MSWASITEDQEKYQTDNQNLGESSWRLPRGPRGPTVLPQRTVQRASYLVVRSAVKPLGISEPYITSYPDRTGVLLRIPDYLTLVVQGGLGGRGNRLVVPPHYERHCCRILRGADGRFVYFKEGDPLPYPLKRGFSPCQGCWVLF